MPVDEPPAEVEVRVPTAAIGPAIARRHIGAVLGAIPEIVDDACLLVSELVTNSVRHGATTDGTVSVHVRRTAEAVRLEVCDDGPGFEPGPAKAPRADAEGGWGLFLVERLSDRWGVERGEHSCVWAEMDLESRLSA